MILIYSRWVGGCVRACVRVRMCIHVKPKNTREMMKIYFKQFIVRSYET